jgi:hypothetical protein
MHLERGQANPSLPEIFCDLNCASGSFSVMDLASHDKLIKRIGHQNDKLKAYRTLAGSKRQLPLPETRQGKLSNEMI